MIANEIEYAGALRELNHLQQMLARLLNEPLKPPDLERLSVRRMIARLHEELGAYEAYVERPVGLVVRQRAASMEATSSCVEVVSSVEASCVEEVAT
jgi:hypothetical protein